MSGQMAIRWVQNEMNDYLNKKCGTSGVDFIIASDTDSMYLDLSRVMQLVLSDEAMKDKRQVIRHMDKFCDKYLAKFIKESFERLYDHINAFAPKMSMKREALADQAIWTGKKHYLMNVWNLEGVEYDKPKLKITGLQAVMAGSISTACRDKIKKAYEYIVEEIALPKTCNGLKKYHDSETIWGHKTPFQVRGALVYNNLLKKSDLSKTYPAIKEGEKVRYTYLREPNDIQCNVISFPEVLPKELNLHQYVDYDTQFQKSFIDSVETVMEAVDWSFEESSSLEQFFS
jgi:hypothetical protein